MINCTCYTPIYDTFHNLSRCATRPCIYWEMARKPFDRLAAPLCKSRKLIERAFNSLAATFILMMMHVRSTWIFLNESLGCLELHLMHQDIKILCKIQTLHWIYWTQSLQFAPYHSHAFTTNSTTRFISLTVVVEWKLCKMYILKHNSFRKCIRHVLCQLNNWAIFSWIFLLPHSKRIL